jgi:hypothetical protein
VSVNLYRRHFEFQRAEIGIKMRKIVDRIMSQRFTSETGQKAANKRYKRMPPSQAKKIRRKLKT